MPLVQPIPRNLEEPARILGLSPLELAACALTYAILSPLLRGVPFSAFVSLLLSLSLAAVIFTLNRTQAPFHGVFVLLKAFRPRMVPVMSFGKEGTQ
jgi:hypothetical protein